MASFDPQETPKVLQIYLEITQYPILAPTIRERMRRELFARGIISPGDLEREVKHKAILSQEREGLRDPIAQESADVWQRRVSHFRENLTDFYFAHNLPHSFFEGIVKEVLAKRLPEDKVFLTFNPELAPWDMLFSRGEMYEALSPEQYARVKHHHREIVVVLTKGLISDQLGFVGIAKDLFTVADLQAIRRRRIGRGKIGGKAAGMMLAWKILNLDESNNEMALKSQIVLPESYFIGADVSYDFVATNDLAHFVDQKYKSRETIESDYPHIREEYQKGRFPDEIVDGLRGVLAKVGNHPLIVRSSSLLEDNFGTSFAGKYDSYFCPNQGSPEENLSNLLNAISLVYASVYNPDALFYRQKMGLLDYDERMAILLQEVQGERHGDYFFPTLAGVGFSYNPFRWTAKIRREDGFLRLVWGMGTRAVDRLSNDYARMVALSHPNLRPVVGAAQLRRYSQHYVDVINLTENEFQTLAASDLMDMDYPSARLLVSVDKGDYIQAPLAYDPSLSPKDLVLTFENLLNRTQFVPLMKTILKTLELRFGRHVDVEFTAEIVPNYPQPEFRVHLLQCRPQASHEWGQAVEVPTAVSAKDTIFTADRLVPHGRIQHVRYIVFVDPQAYMHIPEEATRLQLARLVGKLNQLFEEKSFVLMGPGRWGSVNVDLGVKVTYADIYHTAALIEIAVSEGGSTPEASYGTHFFQDLVETKIYPLALYPDEAGNYFNWDFLRNAPNVLVDLLPEAAPYVDYLRVIDLPAADGQFLEIIMDGENSKALAYLRRYTQDSIW